MMATQYKKLSEAPDVFSRAIIEKTALMLPEGSRHKARLQNIARQEPIEKPPLHDGYRDADRFRIDLTKEDVDDILDELISLEAEVVLYGEETTPYHVYVAHFVDEWSNYHEFKLSEEQSGDLAARRARLADRSRPQLRADSMR